MEREKEIIKEHSLKLSEVRSKAGKEFDKKMTEALLDLNFPQVIFETRVEKSDRYTKDGCDSVVFYVSLNKGSESRPLQEAASGGEMSRIMLAMKSVFASDDDIPTLIFDEIDTGISGRTAQKVAEKIVSISGTHQVICISHLAQIAAMADSHFLIEKNTDSEKTITSIKQLQDNEKIQEIARILGGVSITDAVISSAEEMKKLADSYKKQNV
jgi:DNA repair protein RecN (Recombination protein N)